VIALWVGVLFVGLATLVFLAMPRRQVSRERLGIARERMSISRSMDAFLARRGKREDLAHALNLAGIETEPGQFALRVLLASVLLCIVGLLISPLAALIGLAVPAVVSRLAIKSKGRKRQEAFATQLPEVLQLLISSLRSGHSLPQALDAMVREADDPARAEFDRMLAEARVGVDIHVAMRSMAHRMSSSDLEWVASAVEINRETGGNLADVLENVNETIRGRYRLRRQIRTLTAEGRLSAKVLTGLPIAIFVVRSLFDSNFRDVMYHGYGVMLLTYGAISLTIGWLVVSRIVRVKGA
jgi:tight adherence protein B